MSYRLIVILLVLVRTATAAPADAPSGDTVEIAGEALGSPLIAWIGGSVHYEHRFAASQYGITLRAGIVDATDPLDESYPAVVKLTGLVGLREHWGPWYFEASAGVAGFRRPRYVDDEGMNFAAAWAPGPDFEVEFGRRIDAVEVGAFAAILGLGLRVGITLGD